MVTVLWVALATWVASYILTPVVIRTAIAWDLFDVPAEARRVHTRPIPRLGGVAVFVATSLGLLVTGALGWLPAAPTVEWAGFISGMLLGATILFLAGLWDDLKGISPLAKLLSQCVAAGVVFAFGFRVEVLSLGASEVTLGWLSLPVTIIWVVAITNAFNLIDGLDGLATGIAVVALSTTLAVALALGNFEVALVCGALVGSLVGFLRYNFNPARIFLGDSGSLFVGFMLAVLSVHGSMKSATAVLALVPLFALAIPLLDTSLAILTRWLRGVPLSGADARHIHHRLLATGLSHRDAVVVLYLVAVLLAGVGVMLAFAPPAMVLVIACVGAAVCLGLILMGIRHLRYHEFVEAGMVLASGVLRTRRIIQDQIHARELTEMLQSASSVAEINRLLESEASRFSLLGLELCLDGTPDHSIRSRFADGWQAWRLDYPLRFDADLDDNFFILRIWCGSGDTARPFGAERIARVLAPAIRAWLVRTGTAASTQNPVGVGAGRVNHQRPVSVTAGRGDEGMDLEWSSHGGNIPALLSAKHQ